MVDGGQTDGPMGSDCRQKIDGMKKTLSRGRQQLDFELPDT
jgi:hypothetical protein